MFNDVLLVCTAVVTIIVTDSTRTSTRMISIAFLDDRIMILQYQMNEKINQSQPVTDDDDVVVDFL